ncbi:MAG: dihydrodipicolinate synthase family protein [Clostridiales bacterium]|nr:dihydrodipicolinate synthase family protein [Clostridiales bacterium]
MNQDKLRGVLVASVTPMDARGQVDEGAVGALMDYYADSGLRGAFFPSSTGEYFALSPAQRRACVRAAARHKGGRLTLLANVSDGCLETVLENTRAAGDLGADAAVLMPPQFFTLTQDELYGFFTRAADEAPLPLVVYNHMTRLPSRIEIPLLTRLKAHPNIAGVKDTHNDAARLMALSTLMPGEDGFVILTGGDGMAGFGSLYKMEMLNALCAVRPDLFLEIYAAGRRGDLGQVARLQQRVDRLTGLFTCLKGGANSAALFSQSVKAALALKGLCGTRSAITGETLDEADLAAVRRVLDGV